MCDRRSAPSTRSLRSVLPAQTWCSARAGQAVRPARPRAKLEAPLDQRSTIEPRTGLASNADRGWPSIDLAEGPPAKTGALPCRGPMIGPLYLIASGSREALVQLASRRGTACGAPMTKQTRPIPERSHHPPKLARSSPSGVRRDRSCGSPRMTPSIAASAIASCTCTRRRLAETRDWLDSPPGHWAR